MIVVDEERSAQHLASGVWGRVTLDQLLRKNAAKSPERVALSDMDDRSEWVPGAPESLSWALLDRRVEALAAFFAGLGLQPDTVVAAQLPPTADSVAVLFGLFRAGLVAAPLPLAMREAETSERLAALGAKAIVTVARSGDEIHGERMRAVAGELFQIRFVFGAGADLPDGLIPLERVYEEMDTLGPAPDVARRGNAADHCATIASLIDPKSEARTAAVVPRSHNHWIATGLMCLLEAQVETGAVILSPLAPTGLAGIGAAVMPWLLSCGTLVLGLPASVDTIAAAAAARKATHVVVPARFARRLCERLDAHRAEATVLAVQSDQSVDAAIPRGHRLVDVTTLAERALVARRRKDPLALPTLALGPATAPSDSGIGPTLVEIRLQPHEGRPGRASAADRGRLLIRGAMVPDALPPKSEKPTFREKPRDFDGWVDTAIEATVVADDPVRVALSGRGGDIAGHGALEIDLVELDRIYRDVGGLLDAAAIPLLDADGTERLAAVVVPRPGPAFDSATFLSALQAQKIGLHRLPHRVFPVPAIARAPSGRVLRSGMASHLERR